MSVYRRSSGKEELEDLMPGPKIGFAAGDRQLAVDVLNCIVSSGIRPRILMLTEAGQYNEDLIDLCGSSDTASILRGREFASSTGFKSLQSAAIDYLICIHFPYIISPEILNVPRCGVLNLHPAYLPYNRGWHTPTWAILDGTPYGATLHFIDSGIDTGDIIHQKQLQVTLSDTADDLYKRVLQLELEVFKEAWPMLLSGSLRRQVQAAGGTEHKKQDLKESGVQRIDLDEWVRVEDFMRILRALSTSVPEEAAYFRANGRQFRVRLEISEDLASAAKRDER